MKRRLHSRYGHAGRADRARIASRRKLSPYNERVRDEQRYGYKVREELKAMFFSGGNVGVGMPRSLTIDQAGDRAADFYREHAHEFDAYYREGWGAADAARTIGAKHGVRHFR